MTKNNLALKLIEGTKEDRDKYIHRVDVLDKVKQIITLPDGYVESKKVAEYYEVNPSNLVYRVKPPSHILGRILEILTNFCKLGCLGIASKI